VKSPQSWEAGWAVREATLEDRREPGRLVCGDKATNTRRPRGKLGTTGGSGGRRGQAPTHCALRPAVRAGEAGWWGRSVSRARAGGWPRFESRARGGGDWRRGGVVGARGAAGARAGAARRPRPRPRSARAAWKEARPCVETRSPAAEGGKRSPGPEPRSRVDACLARGSAGVHPRPANLSKSAKCVTGTVDGAHAELGPTVTIPACRSLRTMGCGVLGTPQSPHPLAGRASPPPVS
jgi:hypothetical protein